MRINFRFRHLVTLSLRMAVMRLRIKFGADIFIQSGVTDTFPKSKMAAVAILDFQVKLVITACY